MSSASLIGLDSTRGLGGTVIGVFAVGGGYGPLFVRLQAGMACNGSERRNKSTVSGPTISHCTSVAGLDQQVIGTELILGRDSRVVKLSHDTAPRTAYPRTSRRTKQRTRARRPQANSSAWMDMEAERDDDDPFGRSKALHV